MTDYRSKHVEINLDETAAPKKRWTKRKIAFVTGIGTLLLAPAAAWAAVTFFGLGTFDATAAAPSLTVSDGQLTGSLIPGRTVGGKAIVHNPNDFPITVTSVVIRDDGLAATGVVCDIATVHPQGTHGTFAAPAGAGFRTVLSTPVTVAANGGAEWVSITNAVAQDAGATGLCAVHANIAVEATAGS